MLTKKLGIIGAMAGCCLIAACSSPSQVTTRDGQTTYTSDAPETDEDEDFITYEKNGSEVKVNKSEVREIREVD